MAGKHVERVAGGAEDLPRLGGAVQHLALADDAVGRLQFRHLHEFHEAAIDAVVEEDVIAIRADELDAGEERHAIGDEAAARLAFEQGLRALAEIAGGGLRDER